MANEIERRFFAVKELRAAAQEGKGVILTGHAAVFNTPTDLGWFREQVAPGAFAATIVDDDVRALFNHDPNVVLGRNVAKTLRLTEDADGLAVEIDLPDTQAAKDLAISINRGDVSQMSFGFGVIEEKWEMQSDKRELRTLLRCKLFDVSPVTFPAYPTTDIAQRSAEAWRKTVLPSGIPRSLLVDKTKLAELEASL